MFTVVGLLIGALTVCEEELVFMQIISKTIR